MLYLKNTFTAHARELASDVFDHDAIPWTCALRQWHTTMRNLRLDRGKAIEIGSKGGGLSLFAAIHGCDVTCTGIELPDATTMALHKRYRIDASIEYAALDVCDWDERKTYDVILFKKVFKRMCENDRSQAASNMIDALQNNGLIFFAESVSKEEFLKLFPPSQGHLLQWQSVGFFSRFTRLTYLRRFLVALDCTFISSCLPDRWKLGVAGIWIKTG